MEVYAKHGTVSMAKWLTQGLYVFFDAFEKKIAYMASLDIGKNGVLDCAQLTGRLTQRESATFTR